MSAHVPSVSVVIPTHNYARYLADAIESVLAQEVDGVEIVVVDDGSSDAPEEVVERYAEIEFLSQARQGVGAARNIGVAASRGDLIAYLDADDKWAPGKLRAQLDALAADSSLDLVYGFIHEFLSDDLSPLERTAVLARPGRQAALLPSAILMTRDASDRIGGFGLDSGEALDWALRVNEVGLRSRAVVEAVVHRRIHATNSGRTQRQDQHQQYVLAIKRSLDRRRAARGLER